MVEEVTRRKLLKYSAFTLAGLATHGILPGSARQANAASALTVTHFGGPYAALGDIVGKPFEAAGLGSVNYEVDYPGLIMSKWKAAPDNPPYDIGMLVRAVGLRAGASGLVTPLTSSDIPALKDAHANALPSSGHGVAMIVDSLDFMYDKTKVSEPLTSWLDLWNPEFKDQIVLPAMPAVGMVTLTLLSFAKALGGDERSVDDAFAKIKEIKGNVRTFVTDPNQATQLLERGDILAAPQFSVRISQVLKRNDKIARAVPKEGVPAIPYDLCIAKGSKNQDLAKSYINFVLSESIQRDLAAKLLATPIHKSVSVPKDLQQYVMSDFDKLFFLDYEYIATRQKEWTDRWVREIQS